MAIVRDGTVYDSRTRMALAQRTIERYVVDQPDVPRPPGPARYELLMSTLVRQEPAPLVFERFCHRYPGLAHFGAGPENIYLVSDPDLIVSVFHTHSRQTVKPRVLHAAKSVLGEGLLTSEGEHHLRQRRLLQPAFHHSRIAGYAATMVDEGEHLSRHWRPGAEVDLAAEMSRLTLQIVGRTLFGADLSGDASDVAEALNTVLAHSTDTLQPFSNVRARLGLPPFRQTLSAGDALDAVVQRMIAEHRAAGDTGDLLSMMIAAQEDGTGMDDAQLRDEAMTLVLAGHETTAMWLTWTWLLLARNPAGAAWLHEELDARGGDAPDYADMADLPRTRAVLAESLRLYPPAWMLGRRLQTDLDYEGWTIPAGSTVLAPQWVMHRHLRYWRYPLAFQPQRWINAAGDYDEKAPGQPRGAWYPFGWSNRRCIGDHFAWTEATLLLALLARRWAPRLTDKAVDPIPEGNITLRPRGGLAMTLVDRGDGESRPGPGRHGSAGV